MSRRASLPGASELFRRTSSPALDQPSAVTPAAKGNGSSGGQASDRKLADDASSRAGSPRQKHDSKITVYLSGDELLAMEQARLTLRGEHSLPVDRGRIVREAVAVLLEDFEAHGGESVLVRRLRSAEIADGAQG